MIVLPSGFQETISHFSLAFRKDTWPKVQILLIGSILCPGSRTVCNVLRCVGLSWEKNFAKYHRVLNRDKWSAFQLSSVLLRLVVEAFIPKSSPIVLGMDDTIERRWGHKINKRGIYRDAVRSSKSHFVKCSGLRWLSLMLLSELPWLSQGACWALPILTVLCPSQRFYTTQGKHPKKLTDWAYQIICWLARAAKVLQRPVYLCGDGSFATLDLFMNAQQSGVGMMARMKMNSRLYHLPTTVYPKSKPGPKPRVGQPILAMDKRLTDKRIKWKTVLFSNWYGNRNKEMLITHGVAIWRKSNTKLVKVKWVLLKDCQQNLEPVLLACSNPEIQAIQLVRFFVRRWRVEVTFAEVRRHLGVETQRQWSDLAIERTTPCLMALFTIVCVLGNCLTKSEPIKLNHTAWYKKKGITFSDVLTAVRLELLKSSKNCLFNNYTDNIKALWFLITQAVA